MSFKKSYATFDEEHNYIKTTLRIISSHRKDGIELPNMGDRYTEDDDTSPFLDEEPSYQHSNKRVAAITLYGETESHQYEPDESEVWRQHQLQRHIEDTGSWFTFSKKRGIKRWVLTLITGLICGTVATFVTFFTKVLTSTKFRLVLAALEKEKLQEWPFGSAFAVLCACNLVFGFCAWLAVYLEPLAAGSGIPEVKCFLNGLNIPRIVRMKTLLCKVVGLVFSSSSGLPLGKEGPMVHAGAVIAAGVSQGKSNTLGYDTAFSKFQDFRNDREKRDFVACGAASGVAAAFGAPVGGVLFSLEEGASYWSTKLTWRCFFCAMTTVFTLILFNTAYMAFGQPDSNAMFSFGKFSYLKGERGNYSVWELSIFLFIGCLGGLIGAAFNNTNCRIYKVRSRSEMTKMHKLCEVLGIVLIMSCISFIFPLLWNKCTPLPVDSADWTDQEKNLVLLLQPLYCDKATHYNELASLYLTDSDTAIKQLFHFREVGDHNDYTFSSSALFLFFVPYLFMACVTCGAWVPAGMFVPSLLSGAAFGRLVGHLLHKVDNARGTFADSGTYALLGAAAITGGITRMTISLTVMILEATGDMQYVLPLMLTLLAARLVGNLMSEGLYDIHIHCSNLDYLDEDERVSQQAPLQDVVVTDIMSSSPICVKPMLKVGDAMDILSTAGHHCFPVIDDQDGDVFVGTITRKVLCSLIKHKAFGPPSNSYSNIAPKQTVCPRLSWSTLESIYPRYPEIKSLTVTSLERQAWLDLRPYIDCSAYTINEYASVQRTYRMFRTLGLRHLCVTNKHGRVLGVITRADLLPSHVESKAFFQRKKRGGMASVHSSFQLRDDRPMNAMKTITSINLS